MVCEEDCRTAVFGKTERTVGWEGNGDPTMTGLVRHCIWGYLQQQIGPPLPSMSHSFTLDWLLGFSGPREEAETITGQLREYLRETLHLTLSPTKTLITTARTEAARFLGYEIVNQHADDKQRRALRRRCINGAPGLKVPVEVIRAKCTPSMRRGKPIHLAARLHDSDDSIVAQYQAEYRGFVQYYLRAYNIHRLWRVHRVMQLSLVKTLANQHRMRVNRVYRKYRSTVPTPHGTLTVLEVQHARGQGKKPLVARFGGMELRWQKQVLLNDQPTAVYGTRSEVVQRLLAQVCERCGAMAKCEVHLSGNSRTSADQGREQRRAGSGAWLRADARPWSSANRAMRTFIANVRRGTRSRHSSLESCLRSKDS
jgi:Type II intron maturase